MIVPLGLLIGRWRLRQPQPIARSVLPALAVFWSVVATAPPAAQFVSGVSLVEVYATVTDERGEPVTGLGENDFVVEEDGRPQTVEAFAAGEFPLAVAIAIDHSFSIQRERLASATSAARRFIAGLRPMDRVMVLGIGSEVDVLSPLTTDREVAQASLDRVASWGTTPLRDATLAAADAIQRATGRRALILISDGDDRYSRTTEADVIDRMRRLDVLAYPIATGRARPPIFAELATVTGGRSIHAETPAALQNALDTIGRELRTQYLLGYSPVGDGGPGWRSITVIVKRPGVRVRARDGYLALP